MSSWLLPKNTKDLKADCIAGLYQYLSKHANFCIMANAIQLGVAVDQISGIAFALVQRPQRERRTSTGVRQTFEPGVIGTLDAHRDIHRCYRRRKTDKSWRRKKLVSMAVSAKMPRLQPWFSVSPLHRVKGSLRRAAPALDPAPRRQKPCPLFWRRRILSDLRSHSQPKSRRRTRKPAFREHHRGRSGRA